jgi:hypothetical protein
VGDPRPSGWRTLIANVRPESRATVITAAARSIAFDVRHAYVPEHCDDGIMKLACTFIFSVLFVLPSSSARAQQKSPAESDAWAAVERGWEALRAEDVDSFMTTLHPEFLGWNMSRPTPFDFAAERSSTLAFLTEYDWVSYEIEPVAIRVVDDHAIVHYRYREVVRSATAATRHEEKGRATQVLKRHQRRWKTLTIMSGAVTP